MIELDNVGVLLRYQGDRPEALQNYSNSLEIRRKLAQADPGLRAELAALAGDTTDDLGPIG